MKKMQNLNGIASWKLDDPVEVFLAEQADRSEFWKEAYVQLYKEFDSEYYEKGLPIVNRYIDTYNSWLSEGQREFYIRDMIYSLHRFGAMFDEYFMYDFEHRSSAQRAQYITEKTRWDYYRQMNNNDNLDLYNDKEKTWQIFKAFYRRDVLALRTLEDVNEFTAFISEHDAFIVKPKDGCSGRNIYICRRESIGEPGEALQKMLANGPVVVEELIHQVPEFACFHPRSVNSVRVTAIRTKHGTKIFYPFIRTGFGDDVVDNASHGGVFALVDGETGIIVSDGLRKRGEIHSAHPETGVVYKGYQIPRWDEAKEFVTQLSQVIREDHICGWDITLSDKGWVMIEGNPQGRFTTMQYPLKRGLKPELEAIMEDLD